MKTELWNSVLTLQPTAHVGWNNSNQYTRQGWYCGQQEPSPVLDTALTPDTSKYRKVVMPPMNITKVMVKKR
jgi:hypothetical protein